MVCSVSSKILFSNFQLYKKSFGILEISISLLVFRIFKCSNKEENAGSPRIEKINNFYTHNQNYKNRTSPKNESKTVMYIKEWFDFNW